MILKMYLIQTGLVHAKDCMDTWGSLNGELIYETHGAGTRSYNLKIWFNVGPLSRL